MKTQRTLIAVFSAVLTFACQSVFAQSDDSKVYITLEDMPNAGIYLPGPPDTASLAYIDDVIQWQWGKMQRNTERGALADYDGKWGHEVVAEIYSWLFGFEISEKNTPAIWKFMKKASYTGHLSTVAAKRKYMRTRPFAQFNEHTWSEYDDEKALRHNGSYPSGHTSLFWTVSLAFAEMLPELQDTIMFRAYQYSESRVIVGAHYQSDVEAGRLAASAAFARMHTNPQYAADLKAARAEFDKLRKLDKEDLDVWPRGERFLGQPVDTISRRFYGDVTQYWQAKTERGTERGRQAIADADLSDEAVMNGFAPSVGVKLDAKNTPAIAALISAAKSVLLNNAKQLENTTFRKRPFVQLGEPSLLPDSDVQAALTSSYPAEGAVVGWGLAMLLVEVAPANQNAILTRGFEYGRSAIITGRHYASDVQAGRLLATVVVAHMHTDANFLKMIEKAKKEYAKLKK